jgi:hypothetical protein
MRSTVIGGLASLRALDVFRNIDQETFQRMGIAMAEHTLRHAKESQQALDELTGQYAPDAAYQIVEIHA